MTDPVSAQITINARRGGYEQSGGRLIMTMADHIDAQAATIEEQAERIEDLESACEVVSNEFEGELWQACRRLLQKTHFDFSGGFPDGIQADNFESHMNETLVEFDRACSQLETKDAKIKALVEALNDYISDTAYGGNVEADTAETARAALAAAKETT